MGHSAGNLCLASSDHPEDHSHDSRLAAREVVVLRKVVCGVCFAQTIVDVALRGWQLVLSFEVGAWDEVRLRRAGSDPLDEGLAALVTPGAIEICALREASPVGMPEP